MELARLIAALPFDESVWASDDPYAIVLHQNAGYLVDDERRERLYGRLIALAPTPIALASANHAKLLAIARDGGMLPEQRVERWREIARMTLDQADGDLASALRCLPVAKAKRLLKQYPSIGDPGADHALLFSGIAARACVESNGLRVLTRLGLVADDAAYAAGYATAVRILTETYGDDAPSLRRAYVTLRRHGQTLCKRSAPICAPCPIRRSCPVGRAREREASTLRTPKHRA